MKVHELDVHPALPERIAWLGEIARNVWSSWSPEAGDLFERLDPEGWERLGHNPIALLRGLPQDALDAAAADESFVAMVARVARRLDAYVSDPGWLVPAHPEAADMLVAYFSLEFGLDAGIPLYSGGLGILAGDHLKSASDLGVPLVGVGLLYRSGYFRQALGPDGGQRERYPATDWADLPLRDQLDADGRAGLGGGGDRRRDRAGGRALDPGRPRDPAPAGRRRRGQLGAGAPDHRRALRRRPRPPHAPGDPPGRGGRARPRRGGPQPDRVPHERGPLRAARARAHARP